MLYSYQNSINFTFLPHARYRSRLALFVLIEKQIEPKKWREKGDRQGRNCQDKWWRRGRGNGRFDLVYQWIRSSVVPISRRGVCVQSPSPSIVTDSAELSNGTARQPNRALSPNINVSIEIKINLSSSCLWYGSKHVAQTMDCDRSILSRTAIESELRHPKTRGVQN